MEKASFPLKLLSFAVLFMAAASGRGVNLHIIHDLPLLPALLRASIFGMTFAFPFTHMIDVFLARGLLQRKIRWISITSLYLFSLVLFNRFVFSDPPGMPLFIMYTELLLSLAIGLITLIADLFLADGEILISSKSETVPPKYGNRRFFLTFLEMVFRLFPNPEPVGVYRIGDPDESSMVLVTGNYELTLRRVVRSLKGRNCWLLVCDSRGINIWCSTLAGHFNTAGLVRAIKFSQLNLKVSTRTILLPQLCAANISLPELKEQTGFSGRFGPVRIEDLGEYLKNPGNDEIRRVAFPLKSRMEMALGTLFVPAFLATLILNFIDPDALFFVIPLFLIISLVNGILFPYRLVRGVRWWSLIFGSIVFLVAWAARIFILGQQGVFYPAVLGAAALYFVNEFEGWSPLVKFSMTGAYERATIELSQSSCTGCGACVEVCPRGVFRLVNGKSDLAYLDRCCLCRSCFYQCQPGAISHSEWSRGDIQ